MRYMLVVLSMGNPYTADNPILVLVKSLTRVADLDYKLGSARQTMSVV